jgi:hypothetical protein
MAKKAILTEETRDLLAALVVEYRDASDAARKEGWANDSELLSARADDLAHVISAFPVASYWFSV